jgi:hypothetical protein
MKYLTQLVFNDVAISGGMTDVYVANKAGYGFTVKIGAVVHCFTRSEVESGRVADSLQFEPYIIVKLVNEALAVLLT